MIYQASSQAILIDFCGVHIKRWNMSDGYKLLMHNYRCNHKRAEEMVDMALRDEGVDMSNRGYRVTEFKRRRAAKQPTFTVGLT